ncbi:hypothetical protein RUM44_001942 [Polyplax serrata]
MVGRKPPLELSVTDRSVKAAMPQVLATMAKNLILLGYGMTLGFPTIVIPSLQNAPANATLSLSDEEVSWFSSINLISVPLGCLISGVVTQPFGRKRSMQALTIPFLITWIMFYFADSVGMLYASLALTGLAGGLLEAPILTYVAEITQPHVRGFLSASSSLAVVLGMFTQFLLGNVWDWKTLSAANTAAPVLAFIALCFIPESPHWLISKNRLKDAEKSLAWLRGWAKPHEVQEEFQALVRSIRPDLQPTSQLTYISVIGKDKAEFGKENVDTTGHTPASRNKCLANLGQYKKRTFTIPFFLVCFSFLAGHFSGMTTLTTFAVNIFSTLGAPINKYLATMILGIAQLLGTIVCVVLIHYTGKRPLAFVSAIGAAILYACVGLYAHFFLGVVKLDNGAFISEHNDLAGYSWIPMTCLIGGSFLAFMGLRLLPWILIGEVYPTDVRAFASGASASAGYIMGFASNKTFFKLIDALTLPGVYWFYGGCGLIAAVVLYFVLPETEGWSLYEIEEHFAGNISLLRAGKKKSGKVTSEGIDNPCVTTDQVSKL